MKFKALIGGSLATAVAAVAILIAPAAAIGHTPDIYANCVDGVVIDANSYDNNKANKWEVTVGTESYSGTFGASLHKTFPVPQLAQTTSWSATIQAENGSYKKSLSGNVGPCGDIPETPLPKVEDTGWIDDATSCEILVVTQTRIVVTTPWIWDAVLLDYVIDTANAVTDIQYGERPKTPEEIKTCVLVPQPILSQTTTKLVICESRELVETTIFYQKDPIWNPETLAYDSFTENYEIGRDVSTRLATHDEMLEADCPIPEQPEDKVTYGGWMVVWPICGATEYQTDRYVYTASWIFVDWTWVLDTDSIVETLETEFAPLTKDMKDDLAKKCAEDEEDHGDSLAITGVDPMIPFSIAAGLLAAGLIVLLVRRRKTANQE